FSFELWQDLRQGLSKVRPLVATIGKELFQERIHPEKGRKKQDAAIAILDIGRMNDGVQQQTQRVYENMALLALDLFARVIAMRIDAAPPFSVSGVLPSSCSERHRCEDANLLTALVRIYGRPYS